MEEKKNIKDKLIVLGKVLFVLSGVASVIFLILVSLGIKSLYETTVYTDSVKTDLGDEFHIEYDSGGFPKSNYSITIFNTGKAEKEPLIETMVYLRYKSPEFEVLTNNDNMRSYKVVMGGDGKYKGEEEYIARTEFTDFRVVNIKELDFYNKIYGDDLLFRDNK